MKSSFNFNPQMYRIVVATVCTILLFVLMNAKAEKTNKLKEVKVWQSGGDEIEVQVRTDDGRPARFKLTSESGEVVWNQQIIHSKITSIQGLKKGMYIYNCESQDGDVQMGKAFVK
ncbi:MAG: hypothetical protein EOO01_04430 [Chitinophagaceae bacterium]|nr:MAG: hypothetical protein EOO01_04430 [Chitinophagaceae bacterium]